MADILLFPTPAHVLTNEVFLKNEWDCARADYQYWLQQTIKDANASGMLVQTAERRDLAMAYWLAANTGKKVKHG